MVPPLLPSAHPAIRRVPRPTLQAAEAKRLDAPAQERLSSPLPAALNRLIDDTQTACEGPSLPEETKRAHRSHALDPLWEMRPEEAAKVASNLPPRAAFELFQTAFSSRSFAEQKAHAPLLETLAKRMAVVAAKLPSITRCAAPVVAEDLALWKQHLAVHGISYDIVQGTLAFPERERTPAERIIAMLCMGGWVPLSAPEQNEVLETLDLPSAVFSEEERELARAQLLERQPGARPGGFEKRAFLRAELTSGFAYMSAGSTVQLGGSIGYLLPAADALGRPRLDVDKLRSGVQLSATLTAAGTHAAFSGQSAAISAVVEQPIAGSYLGHLGVRGAAGTAWYSLHDDGGSSDGGSVTRARGVGADLRVGLYWRSVDTKGHGAIDVGATLSALVPLGDGLGPLVGGALSAGVAFGTRAEKAR